LSSRIMTWVNRGVRDTVIRASQTENAPGDRVGVLNRIFSVAYRVRLIGKRIKSRSKLAHYTLKWLIIGGVVYWIFV
jgi:beta-hydroxylase